MKIIPATNAKWEEAFLWIVDEDGQEVPFIRTAFQEYYDSEFERQCELNQGNRHVLVLKARKGGITTREQAKSYMRIARYPNQRCFTVAQTSEQATEIFEIAKRMDRRIRPEQKLGSKREISYPKQGSAFRITSAGSVSFGRGSTPTRLHCTETPHWPVHVDVEEWMSGAKTAARNSEVVVESSPGTIGDWFHEQWIDPSAPWGRVFLPWFVDDRLRIPVLKGEEEMFRPENLTDDERHVWELHGLDTWQLKWRRQTQRDLKKLFLREYPEDPETCFLVAGRSFFDANTILGRMNGVRAIEEERLMYNSTIQYWHWPREGGEYIFGVDTAEGVEGGHPSCIKVIECNPCREVASFHAILRPKLLATVIARLAEFYRPIGGGIVVERNNHGHAVLLALEDMVPDAWIYRHEHYDKSSRGGQGAATYRKGYPENDETRGLLLQELAMALEGGQDMDGTPMPPYLEINDKSLLREALSFKEDRKGKFKASGSATDDRLFALGLALMGRRLPRKSGGGLRFISRR